MEVMIQSPSSSPTKDPFNFNISGAMSSPYLSAPSSPRRFGEYNYLSAPSSPSRISQLYSELDYFSSINEASNNNVDDVVDDGGFAFFVGRELDNKSSRSAEELFDGGKIKPLKPQSNELFTSQEGNLATKKQQNNRGRERQRTTTTETTVSSSNSGRRVARSHSPYRKTNNTWELEEQQHSRQQQQQQPRSIKEETTSTSSKSSRRWSLKDFLLFRSASEGRGSSKDPLRKYFVGYKKSAEEVKGSSFRSSDNSSTHGSRKKGPVSAHEFHYAMKKAESQDKKKKTFLPYRQGILGRLSGFGI